MDTKLRSKFLVGFAVICLSLLTLLPVSSNSSQQLYGGGLGGGGGAPRGGVGNGERDEAKAKGTLPHLKLPNISIIDSDAW